MMLTYTTITGMDSLVLAGLPVGNYGTNDDLSKLPKLFGDWCLKTTPSPYRFGVGNIVAVPTNRRTRKIYIKGRITWLMALGFSEPQAWEYYRVSKRHKRKWDHRVAGFVNDNYNLDTFIIAEILESPTPRKACLANGIYTTMHHGQVVAAMQLLIEINAFRNKGG